VPSTPPSFDAESLLRSLMESIPGAIYRAYPDDFWKVQRVSAEIEAITGYAPEDFVDARRVRLEHITHPDDLATVDREIAAAIAEQRPFHLEYRVVHRDGSIRWALERGVQTTDRDGARWLDGIIFDITERRAAEQLRLEQETRAARIQELEASRARIVAAADAARHRIERDLHDGAQQRLVVASMMLATAERALPADSAAAVPLAAARAELDAGLGELRELARGIHPALLTERGLVPALHALTARASVPVEVHDGVGGRLPAPVETALYYTVAEALTNIDRYACASRAHVDLSRAEDVVELEVTDDGRGGADHTRGSGLRGLEDRLGAVGGRLTLDSPPGGGTRLRARVTC
jgi:PAS domain S-box-containing protein